MPQMPHLQKHLAIRRLTLFSCHMVPGRLLLSQKQIQTRVRELGVAITKSQAAQRPLFLGVMNGALFFLADLLRTVKLDCEISCVRLTSYAGLESTGQIRGLEEMGDFYRDRYVIIVDDIYDTGQTLAAAIRRLRELGAADVKVCVLLEKKRRHQVAVKADWIGFKIPDVFVVGYGLDYMGQYRGLKQIRVMEQPAT